MTYGVQAFFLGQWKCYEFAMVMVIPTLNIIKAIELYTSNEELYGK